MIKTTVKDIHITAEADHTELCEDTSYDMAAVRIKICDQNENVMPFFSLPLPLKAEGPIEIVGPKQAMIAGGMGGTYIRTKGVEGNASLTIEMPEGYDGRVKIDFNISINE